MPKEEVPAHKLSDQAISHVLQVCFVIMCINLALLVLGGILSGTNIDMTQLTPLYLTFCWYILLPTLAVATWFGMEKQKRKWDKKQEDKRQYAIEIKKAQEAKYKAEQEKFMHLTSDEKWLYLLNEMKSRY